jgi:hypothetical protein
MTRMVLLLVAARFASGWGGQYIVVVPSHDLVVVFTGGNYDRGSDVRPLVRGVLNAVR